MTAEQDKREFDRALRNLKAAQRRGGVSAAITESQHRATCEALLDRVDERRREAFRRAVEA